MRDSMTQPSHSTSTPALSETPEESRFPALESPRWQRPRVSETEHLQAAQRLREGLSCVPFYAKRAEKARLEGDEMAYWLGLQASQMTLRRR